MSYIDAHLELSDAQALTASADSTNVIDLEVSGIAAGIGEPICVEFAIDVAADGTTTDETYEFTIATGATTALGTTVSSKTIGYATLVAGYKFVMILDHTALNQYLGVEYVLGGTTPSVTVSASV